jgi:probable phosphoglycerate mutase
MKTLKNTYYAFRHGESQANVEGIIDSDPAVGTVEYGLTDHGREQVRQTVGSVKVFDANTLIVSSDFLRARETAEIIQKMIGAEAVQFDERLRERYFGMWEGKAHSNYSKAWKNDAFDPDREYDGAESTKSVRKRMWDVVQSLEQRFSDRTFVLVSHGDPLMLLETVFRGMEPGSHRSLPYIETAGCRRLND